jgi:Fe-S-cluster-containing hydrogenase component 2
VSDQYNPLHSLKEGNWFKLICGASFQHLPAVRSLALAYTLAGADCIDVAADPAVIMAAKEGVRVAKTLADTTLSQRILGKSRPWLMVSLNDGEDPHFRKAEFDVAQCPSDCHKPCETICPAQAITFAERENEFSGVLDRRCYGCGRCLPVCPSQLIFARSYVSTPGAIAPLIEEMEIDAIEIHTQVGHFQDFQRLWNAIAPDIHRLKLLAISCPDATDVIDYLKCIYEAIAPLPCPLIWQTDGRPMSGDIGSGTTHAAIRMAQKVLQADLPGYIQLAGGTNGYTITKLQKARLLKQRSIEVEKSREDFSLQASNGNSGRNFVSGVAYGSYARSLLLPILEKLETINKQNIENNLFNLQSMKTTVNQLENCPDLLNQAIAKAYDLVSSIKSISDHDYSIVNPLID